MISYHRLLFPFPFTRPLSATAPFLILLLLFLLYLLLLHLLIYFFFFSSYYLFCFFIFFFFYFFIFFFSFPFNSLSCALSSSSKYFFISLSSFPPISFSSSPFLFYRFCRAHRGGGETKGSKLRPSVLRPSVHDAYKNLNNFPTLHLFVTKLGW